MPGRSKILAIFQGSVELLGGSSASLACRERRARGNVPNPDQAVMRGREELGCNRREAQVKGIRPSGGLEVSFSATPESSTAVARVHSFTVRQAGKRDKRLFAAHWHGASAELFGAQEG